MNVPRRPTPNNLPIFATIVIVRIAKSRIWVGFQDLSIKNYITEKRVNLISQTFCRISSPPYQPQETTDLDIRQQHSVFTRGHLVLLEHCPVICAISNLKVDSLRMSELV